MVLLLVTLTTFMVSRISNLDENSKVTAERSRRIETALDAREALVALGRSALSGLIFQDPEQKKTAQEDTVAAIQRMIDDVKKLAASPQADEEQKKTLDALTANAALLESVLTESEAARATDRRAQYGDCKAGRTAGAAG